MKQTVDREKCVGCGQCIEICGMRVFRQNENGIEVDPARTDRCMLCGQCLALCPSGAVTVEGIDEAGSRPMPESIPDADALMDLVVSRRSIRRFTNEPVSREDLGRIVEIAKTAPMSFPPTDVELVVFPTREQLDALMPYLIAGYREFGKMLSSPIGRFFLGRATGKAMLEGIREHMGPLIEPMVRAYEEKGEDHFMWGAPAMILLHAPAGLKQEDSLIAATYIALAAHSMGLGATILGAVAPIVEGNAELRGKLGIPDGNKTEYTVVIGHPDVKFRRTIPREFKSVTWAE